MLIPAGHLTALEPELVKQDANGGRVLLTGLGGSLGERDLHNPILTRALEINVGLVHPLSQIDGVSDEELLEFGPLGSDVCIVSLMGRTEFFPRVRTYSGFLYPPSKSRLWYAQILTRSILPRLDAHG